MSSRSTFLHLAAKVGILFGALFLVSVLLAAIPGHRAPTPLREAASQSSSSHSQESQAMDHGKMTSMLMHDAKPTEPDPLHHITPLHLPPPTIHTTLRTT